ncbi:hypothetical protein PHJA_002263200 [Phtheirospermum japonicum]|uniref:FLZ-type domain-containing protein n=1 Tax=Phtheirospermum japonicum TaxID=374723 RepID=A0A830CSK0_9LAMI|nr:hypothetical protein PHJA_002263200 [Phtheirospermum japonicum]
MLGKKYMPVIGILTSSLISGSKSGLLGFATSPRTHFEPKPAQFPKGLKKSFDFGGVGLGITAALESSGEGRREFPTNKALISRNSSRSIPIPTSSPKQRLEERMESESLEEEDTIVTHYLPNKSYTKVYDHGGRGGGMKSNKASIFHISPTRFSEAAAGSGTPADDFLSSCHLCHKRLQGEDIYMYR